VKKLSITLILATIVIASAAQDSTGRKNVKNTRKEVRRQKINNLIRQAEEGVMVYHKQTIIGVQLRTNGYGGYFEMGRMKTNRKTNIYRLDITEIKHLKEEKQSSDGGIPGGGIIFGNPFIYGKLNNFYQATLGFGQQYILGQKGNKNGVSISAVYSAGLALGLLRPYYVEVRNPSGGDNLFIKYSIKDSALFLGPDIVGGGGLRRGWNELSIKPGGFAKAALRFDYGRFNEVVSAIEIGISGEFYSAKIPILFNQKDKQFFFQGYIAMAFGRRR
jgi:hypothetical protein